MSDSISGFSGSTFTLPAGVTSTVSSSLSGVSSTLGGITGSASSLVSSSGVSSLLGSSTASSIASALGVQSTSASTDFRVRIRPQANAQTQVLGAKGSSNILSILYETNGMFFPYTPTIAWNQAVEYDQLHFVHSNQDYYAYKNTPSTKIDISGKFSLQNQREGEYMIACMHFLRTVSKMYFGASASQAGTGGMPPPVLLLSGYGDFMLPDLPVIVMNHSYNLDDSVDYVTISVAGGKVRLPTLMTINVSLIVQHTPSQMRTDFDLDKFRTGQLMKSKGWI